MIENAERIGRFTSSQNYKLASNGKKLGTIGTPGLTYIEEKKIERRMGRSLETETYSRDMTWGLFLEGRVHSFLFDPEYLLLSKETKVHPTIEYWSGSADLVKALKKVGDIKCYQPKNFAILTDAILLQDIANFKAKCVKEYWQLVSNAIIHNVPNAEIISYMPYKSELEEIRELATNYDDPGNEWKYRFISESPDSVLAYLPDGGYYKNLNSFEFEIPQSDKDFLTERVLEAGKLLIGENHVIIASHDKEANATIVEPAFDISKLKKIN